MNGCVSISTELKNIGIDERIWKLSDVLDALPDMYVFSTCGGHENPTECSQVSSDEFYAELHIEPTKAGFLSLGCVTLAGQMVDCENVSVTAWIDNSNPHSLAFSLNGVNGVDPDELSEVIEWVSDRCERVEDQKGCGKFCEYYLGMNEKSDTEKVS